ncbi:MAG: SixA phosphatase family protein [Pyrinomonadaceae bacterium]
MTKTSFKLAGLVLAMIFLTGIAAAQNKTILLVRHAEKDTSESVDQNDPPLTDAGRARAERLLAILKRYKVGTVYSTDFRRTRETAGPVARRRGLNVETYDAKKPDELIDRIMKSKTKRFLIVGHSNTVPGLANLLLKKKVFANLDDAEHGVIWLVRIKNGAVVKTQVLTY